MAPRFRLTPQTLSLLELFLADPNSWRYGYDLSRVTRLASGTLYPILMRLARHRLLETRWRITEPGKPPRHLYRLTTSGRQFAREKLATAGGQRPVRRLAPAGGRA